MKLESILCGALLTAGAACVEPTGGDSRIYSHTLYASTADSATDSIRCGLFASLAMTDSIQAPWSGQASVHVTRQRRTAPFLNTDTTLTNVTVTVSSAGADSLVVTITGSRTLTFSQGKKSGKYESKGPWQCDAGIPLANAVPGQALGSWYLSANRYID
jgi:hypothetical protein